MLNNVKVTDRSNVDQFYYVNQLRIAHYGASLEYKNKHNLLVFLSILVPLIIGIATLFISDSAFPRANLLKSVGTMLIAAIGAMQVAFNYAEKRSFHLEFAVNFNHFSKEMRKRMSRYEANELRERFENMLGESIPTLPKRFKYEINNLTYLWSDKLIMRTLKISQRTLNRTVDPDLSNQTMIIHSLTNSLTRSLSMGEDELQNSLSFYDPNKLKKIKLGL